jgi:hypothetical protein
MKKKRKSPKVRGKQNLYRDLVWGLTRLTICAWGCCWKLCIWPSHFFLSGPISLLQWGYLPLWVMPRVTMTLDDFNEWNRRERQSFLKMWGWHVEHTLIAMETSQAAGKKRVYIPRWLSIVENLVGYFIGCLEYRVCRSGVEHASH